MYAPHSDSGIGSECDVKPVIANDGERAIAEGDLRGTNCTGKSEQNTALAFLKSWC
jgi:hypothetical protein